jgi:arylsulfatase A-like enzyme
MQVYAAMIDRVDQNVGKILAKIKALGEEDNTLIMFASDNGSSAENVDTGTGEVGSLTRWSSLQKDWAMCPILHSAIGRTSAMKAAYALLLSPTGLK